MSYRNYEKTLLQKKKKGKYNQTIDISRSHSWNSLNSLVYDEKSIKDLILKIVQESEMDVSAANN